MASPRDHYGKAQRLIGLDTSQTPTDGQLVLMAQDQAETMQGILAVLMRIERHLDIIAGHQR